MRTHMKLISSLHIFIVTVIVEAEECIFEQYPENTQHIRCKKGYQYDCINMDKLLFDYPYMESLCISDTSVKIIPEGLSNFSMLSSLKIINNWKINLPADLTLLTDLTCLHLVNIQLYSLPEGFVDLLGLEELKLSFNSLTELPLKFDRLKYLKILDLQNNCIESLPVSFDNLSNLKSLNISSNAFESYPRACESLLNLSYLHINDNKISFLPATISNLKNLKVLSAERNNLRNLPNSLSFLSKLTYLNLRSNNISLFLADLVSLKYLNLSSNKIKAFPEKLLGLKMLKTLDISNNYIKVLPKRLLSLADTLEYFNVFGNTLRFDDDEKYLEKSELISTFGLQCLTEDNLNCTKDYSRSIYDEHSKNDVHWNVNKLRSLMSTTVPNAHSLPEVAFLDILNDLISTAISDAKQSVVFKSFITAVFQPLNTNSVLSCIISKNRLIIKNYLESILKELAKDKNPKKINLCIELICNCLYNTPSEIVKTLMCCYYICLDSTLDQELPEDCSIEEMVFTIKASAFSQLVTTYFIENPSKFSNLLLMKLFSEIFNVSFDNEPVDKETFDCLLDSFFFIMKTEDMVKSLTAKVNENKSQLKIVIDYIQQCKENNNLPENFLNNDNVVVSTTEVSLLDMEFFLVSKDYLQHSAKFMNYINYSSGSVVLPETPTSCRIF